MSTKENQLVKEFEEIYENSCLKKAVETGNRKCLALDSQELAIMSMCIECLERQEGINKDDYMSNGLFILQKKVNWRDKECKHDRVRRQPLKYKRYSNTNNYKLENISELLLVYYAILLLYANNENTGDYCGESKRRYFIIYAYFACICPKTFSLLFFNQVHLFMSKTSKQQQADELRVYLDYTDDLWKGYVRLLANEKVIEISEEVITKFCEIMSYDEEVLFNGYISIYNLKEDGFLAFDFKSGDTLRGYRFKIVLMGIEYFKWYLKYLKDGILKQSFKEEYLLKKIDNILESAEKLKSIFESFLEKEEQQPDKFERKFDNIHGLLHNFYKYCEDKVALIDL